RIRAGRSRVRGAIPPRTRRRDRNGRGVTRTRARRRRSGSRGRLLRASDGPRPPSAAARQSTQAPTPQRPTQDQGVGARPRKPLLMIQDGRQIPAHLSPGLSMRPLHIVALVSLAAVSSLAAQDTPTEREAAKDVLRKMATLEQSLDVPGWVTRLTALNPARDQVAARAKELMEKELLAMGDDITRHPEIGFVEFESIKKLTDYLKAHDFDVEMGVGGLKTAFVARYRKNNGAPNLG